MKASFGAVVGYDSPSPSATACSSGSKCPYAHAAPSNASSPARVYTLTYTGRDNALNERTLHHHRHRPTRAELTRGTTVDRTSVGGGHMPAAGYEPF